MTTAIALLTRDLRVQLSDLETRLVHEPWRLPWAELAERGYPPPIADLGEASERFLTERGRPREGAR